MREEKAQNKRKTDNVSHLSRFAPKEQTQFEDRLISDMSDSRRLFQNRNLLIPCVTLNFCSHENDEKTIFGDVNLCDVL